MTAISRLEDHLMASASLEGDLEIGLASAESTSEESLRVLLQGRKLDCTARHLGIALRQVLEYGEKSARIACDQWLWSGAGRDA